MLHIVIPDRIGRRYKIKRREIIFVILSGIKTGVFKNSPAHGSHDFVRDERGCDLQKLFDQCLQIQGIVIPAEILTPKKTETVVRNFVSEFFLTRTSVPDHSRSDNAAGIRIEHCTRCIAPPRCVRIIHRFSWRILPVFRNVLYGIFKIRKDSFEPVRTTVETVFVSLKDCFRRGNCRGHRTDHIRLESAAHTAVRILIFQHFFDDGVSASAVKQIIPLCTIVRTGICLHPFVHFTQLYFGQCSHNLSPFSLLRPSQIHYRFQDRKVFHHGIVDPDLTSFRGNAFPAYIISCV